jgi:hypothetical protein
MKTHAKEYLSPNVVSSTTRNPQRGEHHPSHKQMALAMERKRKENVLRSTV